LSSSPFYALLGLIGIFFITIFLLMKQAIWLFFCFWMAVLSFIAGMVWGFLLWLGSFATEEEDEP